MTVAAVVAAAGYGSFREGVPKVVESISKSVQRPMISEVTSTLRRAGIGLIVVVTNPLFHEQIRDTLEMCGERAVHYASQPERRGAAEAVSRGEKVVREGIGSILVVFGDMPLWSPETVRNLIKSHLEERPQISMVSISIADARHPRVLERYGRILRGGSGEIIGIVEPGDATYEQLRFTKTVNPSLYVFDRVFFREHVAEIPARVREDGFAPEQYLPPLVAIAATKGARIREIPLTDRREALGVNTAAELEEVRRVVIEMSERPTATSHA